MAGLIDNQRVRLEEVLKEGLRDDQVKKFNVAVGYFFISGLKAVLPELKEFIERGGQFNVLIGNYISRETYEDLVSVLKDPDLAMGKQPNHLIEAGEHDELLRKVGEDLEKQVLFSDPTLETEDYLLMLKNWGEEGKFHLRVYPKERFHAKAYVFETDPSSSVTRPQVVGVVGSSNFSLPGLRANTELNAAVYTHDAEALQRWYEERWGESDDFSESLIKIFDNSWISYSPENFPLPYFVYLKAIYELYKESLKTTEEIVRSFRVYRDLYDFQKWAVLRGIEIATKYGGAMVSDVVGMGKTYVGAALLEHFHHLNYVRGQRGKILIICPPKLESWWNRIITKYDLHAVILSSGMLSREDYYPRLLRDYGNATTVLIDESHHFRNTNTNRYENLSKFLPLVNHALLLTATPYARGPRDIYNQIKLFHLEDITKIPITPPNLKEFINKVEDEQASLTELLAHVMVRRTRYDIIDQYGGVDENGREYIEMEDKRLYLPKRELETEGYSIEEVYGKGLYDEIVDTLGSLNYARYGLGSPKYLKAAYKKQRKYVDLSTIGRNLRGLMKVLLLKRLESSLYSFKESLRKMLNSYEKFYRLLTEKKELAIGERLDDLLQKEEELEWILDEIESRRREGKVEKYDLEAFHVDELTKDLKFDIGELKTLHSKIKKISDEVEQDYSKDDKLRGLVELLDSLYTGKHEKVPKRVEKIIMFSEYVDTVKYLERGLKWFQERGKLSKSIRIATAMSETEKVDEIIERFAPRANQARERIPKEDEFDLLVATDIMGEGLNLQDSNIVINYDIHWNPLKLIQRIGRVDRLGTEYETIYVFNFLPEKTLEMRLGIVEKVSGRISDINKVLGMDAKILREDEKPNRSFMKHLYQGNMDKISEYERRILAKEDSVSTSVNELARLMEKQSDLIEKVKRQNGLRSARNWDKDNDAVFVLYKSGDYLTPYLVEFDGDGGRVTTSAQEAIIEIIKCEREEKPARIARDLFRKRYSKACRMAREKFKREINERRKLGRIRKSKDRDYVEKGLKILAEQTEDPKQREIINLYRNIIHQVVEEPIISEFKDLRTRKIKDENLFEAVKEIISKYNLEEKYKERKRERKKVEEEPPHVLCGMYLKGGS
jgi:superfamily II DNA/RNA helicase